MKLNKKLQYFLVYIFNSAHSTKIRKLEFLRNSGIAKTPISSFTAVFNYSLKSRVVIEESRKYCLFGYFVLYDCDCFLFPRKVDTVLGTIMCLIMLPRIKKRKEFRNFLEIVNHFISDIHRTNILRIIVPP